MAIKITNRNFASEVLDSDKPVLLDFWAEWCGPCRSVAPILDEIAEEHPEIKVGKVNVDEEDFLSKHFGIQNIPFLVCMKDGKIHKSTVGLQPKEDILKLLED